VTAQALGNVALEDINDSDIGETFRLFFGFCGDEPGELLVVTDANGLFGMSVDLIRLLRLHGLVPPMLVVGIGYANHSHIAETLDARARDLTPSPMTAFPGSGGGEAFRRFLRGSVIPRAQVLAPAAGRTTYFGHSLGGMFGAFDLVSADRLFDRHIISSPSLWWGKRELARRDLRPVTGDAFFCIGANETDEGRRREGAGLPDGHPLKPVPNYLDMVADLVEFTDALSEQAGAGLRMTTLILPDEYHATAAPVALTRGLRWHFEGRG
jgi:predicted alpha/beta superfamily hydrolase